MTNTKNIIITRKYKTRQDWKQDKIGRDKIGKRKKTIIIIKQKQNRHKTGKRKGKHYYYYYKKNDKSVKDEKTVNCKDQVNEREIMGHCSAVSHSIGAASSTPKLVHLVHDPRKHEMVARSTANDIQALTHSMTWK